MGWMDEYNEALKEEKKKKRKKDKKNDSAFVDEYREELDDIAPVAQAEGTPFKPVLDEEGRMNSLKSDGRTWFQAGALDDDAPWYEKAAKTWMGTGKDIATDLTAGILGMGEKAVDAGAYLLGGGAGLIGQDKFQKKMQDFIKKDLYDEEKVARSKITQAILSPPSLIANAIADKAGVDEERDSVMGEKTDSLVQSGGQLLGTVALQAAGVPWFVTSGVTSFGAEAEGALNEGASYGEAGLSAAISAGAEILTEKLFGGSGLGEKGLINLEPLTKGVSSKLVKALADWGVDMMAEGTEEVVSEFAGNLASALYKEENLGQLLFSEDAVDRYIESFIGGAALGGGMNVGKVSNSIKTGRDYRTDLTTNEQKVVDKLYEEKIAEESKNGKVTSKRKAEIYDDIVEQMDKGYISTDTIEEILGGETYKSYSDTVKNEDSLVEQEKTLTEEFNKLNRKPWRDMTGEEHDRLEELKEQLPKLREQIKANEKTGTRNQLKSQLSTEVSQMVKGDRLVESYNERIRMKQDFKADFNKYKGTKHEDAAKKTLESAIKAGANNSNRVRDLVEMAAQASADTGLTFEFKSGENIKKDFIARQQAEIAKLEAMERTAEQDQKLQKLKETLAKVESGEVVVNGDISGGNIVLNLDSHKPLNRVVGHEITHSLEPKKGTNTKEYTALKDSLFAYAKTKGIDVDAKLKSLAEQYEGVTDADPEAELVADLVGDFLFTDSKYIQNLSTENRNLFQRLWDEVKYLCKIATAGSQEARELARVQKAFEDAYRNGAHKTTGTKHSISETTDGRFVAVVDNDILSNIDTSSWDKTKKDEARKAASDALKNFSGGIVVDGITRKVNRTSRREFTRSKDTERLYKNSPDIFADKMRAAEVVDDIVVAATNWNRDGGLKHQRSDDFVDFDHGKTLIVSGNAKYSAEVVVGITDTGEAVFYDVVDMTPTSFDLKKEESPTTATTQDAIGDIQGDSSADNVAQNGEEVKHQLSLTESQNEQGLGREQEVQYSISRDTEFSDKAISMNDSSLRVSKDVMANAKSVRERIAARMNEIKDNGLVGLPEDIEGNTYIANSSYDGTEENTTICPRSLASEAFVDAVSEYLGRPLTVEEQIYISQDLQGRSLTPECTYCYVATDRKAYRAFLGEYINQRDSVLQKLKENPTADISRSGELYREFLDGRKDTNPMYSRFKMWVDAYKTGTPMVEASHLANLSKLMGDINSEFGEELKPQIVDAMKYAQSASWAKKRVNYVAYNGHILKWKQDRINKLNSHYGLRMYSFSDFHPAFVLENMQMITDASVRGLKMLGYTKDTDFVDIFAPSGMNINVSTFGFESGGNVYENNIIGANWEKAKALRAQYPNVGVTFVATNDTLVNWALEQDWIDVVIPYHLVRTGAEVAKAFNYTNYTSESSDVKDTGWKKGDKKYIAPTEHNNDKATYLAALEKNHLKPRFARFLDNPNYMKLVNECRQSASMSKPVQPIFNEEAANAALSKLEANGYYQPIGGSVDRMYEIAAEVADNMIAPTQNSLSYKGEDIAPMGDLDVYGSDFGVQEDIAPVAKKTPTDNAKVAQTEATVFPDDIAPVADAVAPEEIAPVAETGTEAIRPKRERSNEPRMVRADSKGKQRKWVGTSTESDAVDGKVLPEDLDQDLIHYQPISNKKTLGNANARLDRMGYEASVTYLNSQFANNKVTLDDIALGERLIQEAVKKGDTKTAGDLIMDISILGTELGQKVQALSIIKRLTPEGQLRMLQRTVERGKTKGDKAFEGVEITQDMIDHILKTYGKDGTYDQAELNQAVEDVKQKIADQMDVTAMDKINAWRYLSMLGNPKTHIRNLVSNVAMKGTVAVKNAMARTIETIAPVKNRTKTWKSASEYVKNFAQQTTIEMKDIISGDSKYSESTSIKEKRQIFKNKILNGVYEFNSDMLGKEDWWFSKSAFTNSLSEFLTANGISTEADIQKNPKLVEKAKQYALEQAQIATFRQYSWLASKINDIERKNAATEIAVGSVLPFKKTPINIAKTGLSYSPLGFMKTLTYDAYQVKKGNMESSELIDHLSQNVTGSALTLVGYMLASAGFLNGAGDDDKEGDYDYQLGKQAYSVNIGGATYSLSWLSPVAMPLFVGANAYEQLVEGKEWNGDVVVETLAQTLDPLSEMSFISSLDSVLSSYDSGLEKFAGIFETAAQNYVTQFAPTLMSQVAQATDDTKRSTKVSADSGFKFFDETINKLKYKIPVLRQTLEPSTDIWGNEIKQSENVLTRAFESFLAPYAKREDIATAMDEEIKSLYGETGDSGVIPSVPYNYINYDGVKYEMSARDFTDFKKMYGQTAADWMERLFDTDTYQNADSETRADMVNKVYDFARDEARREYFSKVGVDYTNATADDEEYYKENPIKGAIEHDLPVDEYVFSEKYPEKYSFFKKNGISYSQYDSADEDGKRAYTWAYENPEKFTLSKAVAGDVVTYRKYTGDLYDIKADKDSSGKSITGSRKEKVLDYINNMDADYGAKIILFKSEYPSDDTYNNDIIDYLNGRDDISYEEMETILKELGFTIDSSGNISWD